MTATGIAADPRIISQEFCVSDLFPILNSRWKYSGSVEQGETRGFEARERERLNTGPSAAGLTDNWEARMWRWRGRGQGEVGRHVAHLYQGRMCKEV